jgi:hypothetical protein
MRKRAGAMVAVGLVLNGEEKKGDGTYEGARWKGCLKGFAQVAISSANGDWDRKMIATASPRMYA